METFFLLAALAVLLVLLVILLVWPARVENDGAVDLRRAIANAEYKFGEAGTYYLAWMISGGGNRLPILLTHEGVMEARRRARRNEEDVAQAKQEPTIDEDCEADAAGTGWLGHLLAPLCVAIDRLLRRAR